MFPFSLLLVTKYHKNPPSHRYYLYHWVDYDYYYYYYYYLQLFFVYIYSYVTWLVYFLFLSSGPSRNFLVIYIFIYALRKIQQLVIILSQTSLKDEYTVETDSHQHWKEREWVTDVILSNFWITDWTNSFSLTVNLVSEKFFLFYCLRRIFK